MFGFQIRTRQNGGPDSPRPPARGSPYSVGSPRQADRDTTTPRSSGTGSPSRIEVGEIDTRAPFESVKAAVSLFGDAGALTSPKATKPPTVSKKLKNIVEERVLEKETQLHLALKVLDELRINLRTTESTKAQAQRELDKANRTLQELTGKLEIVSESKQTAIEATEAAKLRAKELEEQKSSGLLVGGDAWKQDVDSEREQYKASAAELILAKQELTTLRQDFDVVLEAKLVAFQQAADAQHITQVNQEKLAQLSKEATIMRHTLGQVKLASLQTLEEQEKQNAERQAHFESHQMAKEEVDKKIKSLKEEYRTELSENLEETPEEITEAAKVLQEQLNNVRDSDMSSLVNATSELDDAKKAHQEIVEEENSLRSLVDSLKLELENVQKEHSELKGKASEAESVAESLKTDLEKNKIELEAALAGKVDSESAYDEMQLKLEELSKGAENDRQEAEENKKNVSLLKQEAETAYRASRDTEERLQIALNEVEEAKAAARRAGDIIHNTSNTNAACATNSESSGKIRLSVKEFESLSKKSEVSGADADLKVATVMAQIETIKASENEALKNLEASIKENNEIEAAIQDALKQAEMAEAAKQVVEGELRKWREKEQDAVGQSFDLQYEDTNI